MSLFIESSFILPKGIIDSYIKFKTWNSCSYSDKEKKASQANIWTPVFSTRFAIPIIGIIYALLWNGDATFGYGSLDWSLNGRYSRTLFETNNGNNGYISSLTNKLLNKMSKGSKKEVHETKDEKSLGIDDKNILHALDLFINNIKNIAVSSKLNSSDIYKHGNTFIDNLMSNDEIDQEIESLLNGGNYDREKLNKLWWQIMRNEELKYVSVNNKLYKVYKALRKKYNVDNSYAENKWKECKRNVIVGRVEYQNYINKVFLDWINGDSINYNEFIKLVRTCRVTWKKLRTKMIKALKKSLKKSFEKREKELKSNEYIYKYKYELEEGDNTDDDLLIKDDLLNNHDIQIDDDVNSSITEKTEESGKGVDDLVSVNTDNNGTELGDSESSSGSKVSNNTTNSVKSDDSKKTIVLNLEGQCTIYLRRRPKNITLSSPQRLKFTAGGGFCGKLRN
ncbi:Plasmodium exported protein (PHISTb), unknown function [Plasmodium gaboni]|uniref:Plasmodium RESA N-terminal domain-containing protein n=1 Tax=Plasmodium gaboni TaxID=647221 RepID=A0ABY1US72_9APIC|nr:Plasmodium exported protein (PHISTb), unknown function [Plasmodium gaboni]